MGKHKKKKSKKSKKERRYSTSSSSSSAEEWIEKSTQIKSLSEETSKRKLIASEKNSNDELNREEWMTLPTLFASSSNTDRKREREITKRTNKERELYNPSESSRELNPFWKSGGDGLPSASFKKPTENDVDYKSYKNVSVASSGWRKNVNKRISADVGETSSSRTQTERCKEENVDEQPHVLNDNELNVLAAKLVKAEILGNASLVKELKEKLDNAKNVRNTSSSTSNTQERDVLLTQTDSKGFARPLKMQSDIGEYSESKHKKQKVETHTENQRVRYFADDDKYSLKQMFENEKYNSVADQNLEFLKVAGKMRKNDDLDEVFVDNIRKKKSDEQLDKKNKEKAINEHKLLSHSLDNCNRCLQSESMSKHLMISLGETIYLSLPSYEPVTNGHCLLVPARHVTCATQLDENEWAELMDFRRALSGMFSSKDEDVIFFETAMYLSRFPHMAIECVPVPKEQGDLAPIYFKKAIDESETEWASNKKLVSLAGRDVRRAIPKGLPYFSVSFGMEEGFAHVIEDQRHFPNNFAQEIIGGILDLHHSKWRKPKRQKFEEQKQRVLEFSQEWSKYDCTIK